MPLEQSEFDAKRSQWSRVPRMGDLLETEESFGTSVVLSNTETQLEVARFAVRKQTWDTWWLANAPRFNPNDVRTVRAIPAMLPAPARDARHNVPLTPANNASNSSAGSSNDAPTCTPDDIWNNRTLDDIPEGREGHSVIWTGVHMFLWGGAVSGTAQFDSGFRYDPATDFAPISLIGVAPLVLVAPANAPGADARAFLAAARTAGDKWSYGSPGVGTVGHLGMELLKARTGIQPVHVPYPGYPQVFNALATGDLQLSMLPPALALAQIKGGKLRGIGVTSGGRSPLAPDLPSMADAGVKNFNLEIWNAVVAPASMPPAHVKKLSDALSAIVRTPEMRQRLFQQGWQAVGSSPEGLANRIQADTQTLGAIIRSQNIRTD